MGSQRVRHNLASEKQHRCFRAGLHWTLQSSDMWDHHTRALVYQKHPDGKDSMTGKQQSWESTICPWIPIFVLLSKLPRQSHEQKTRICVSRREKVCGIMAPTFICSPEKENSCDVLAKLEVLGLGRGLLTCPSDVFAADLGCFLIRGYDCLRRDTCDFAKCHMLEVMS